MENYADQPESDKPEESASVETCSPENAGQHLNQGPRRDVFSRRDLKWRREGTDEVLYCGRRRVLRLVPDATYPNMWRVAYQDGELGDLKNLTWARHDVEVVAYADNILVMAKSESDADAMTKSLGLALKKHPAGRLWPKTKSFPPGGPIEFLGHRITAHGDDVRVQPTPENREKFERKMKRGLARLRNPSLAPAARTRLVRELKSELSSHAANFRLCDGMKEYRQYWSAQITAAKHGGSTMPQSKQPSTKRMVFWPHHDQEEIITAALNRAKQEIPTQFQTVALEAIAISFMATGIAFKDWKPAVRFARQHTDDPLKFAQEVLSFVEELCPELAIEATIIAKATSQNLETAGESIGPAAG
jgi:hypothetical protein